MKTTSLVRRAVLFCLALVLTLPYALNNGQIAQSLDGDDFDPGRIIDDQIFYDGGGMSAAQIQSFLEDRVGGCDTNGTGAYAGTTRAQYALNSYNNGGNGIPAPFICIDEYYENPSTGKNNYWEYNESQDRYENVSNEGIPSGAKSAAQLLYEVSQDEDINPKVLLVLVQKEQALIADSWPWGIQYERAAGYGCPDTAPCNDEYFGFYNQIKRAAAQFNTYRDFPSFFNHEAGKTESVRYHPNSSCGSSNEFIETDATAGLYNYTPYQPNQAALDNLYGTGNSCSAYGNRNFWRIYNDWFGSTVSTFGDIDKFRTYITWRGDWEQFVSLDIGGNGDSEILMYQPGGSTDGSARGEFYDIRSNGDMPRIKTYTTWRNWDSIVPVDMDGDGRDELLFFKKSEGSEPSRAEFYDVRTDGKMPRIKTYTGLTDWDRIVPINIDNDPADELLFYQEGSSGLGIFYDVTPTGKLFRIKTHTTWRGNWDDIVPIDIGGNGEDELLFYLEGTQGRAEFYNVLSSGVIDRDITHTDWRGDLDLITPVDIQGTTGPELFLYSKDGVGEFVNVIPGGETQLLKRHTLRTSIDLSAPLNVDSEAGYEILLYNQRETTGRGDYFDISR